MSPLPGLFLVLLSLVAWTAAAQAPSELRVRVRRVPLTGATVVVRVAPGIPTTLNFDADINPQKVVVGDPERITLLSVAPRSITLTPVVELGPAVALRVRFADAALALAPEISLRTDAAEVDAQVSLYRDARTPELLLAQVAELQARTTACEADLASLRERGRATGPTSLALSGLFEDGVQVASEGCRRARSAGGLKCKQAMRYFASTWVVVALEIEVSRGQPVWKPGEAWLVAESSRQRFSARVVAAESEAQAPNETRTVAMEFAMPSTLTGEVYRLEVQEAGGSRTLSLSGLTMDAMKPAPEKVGP